MGIPFNKIRDKIGLDDKLTFGQYSGHTIKEILELRPTYVDWLIKNTDLRFYQSVHEELTRCILRYERQKPRKSKYTYYGTSMLGYDHDTLSDWDCFDDVPF